MSRKLLMSVIAVLLLSVFALPTVSFAGYGPDPSQSNYSGDFQMVGVAGN